MNNSICPQYLLPFLELMRSDNTPPRDYLCQAIICWASRELSRQGLADREDVIGPLALSLLRLSPDRWPKEGKHLQLFLRRALRFHLLNQFKKEQRYASHVVPLSQDCVVANTNIYAAREGEGDPSEIYLSRKRYDQVHREISYLSIENQEIFLRWVRGDTLQELSARFHLKENTVKQRLYSIRQQLKRRLVQSD